LTSGSSSGCSSSLLTRTAGDLATIEKRNLLRVFQTPNGGGGDDTTRDSNKLTVTELAAECFGTFLIVQLGTAAVMSAVYTDSLVGLYQIAAVWSIAVTTAIFSTASLSPAHLNPAVSLAFALVRPSDQFGPRKLIPYSLAQLTGAVFGSAVNLGMYASTIRQFEATNSIVRASANAVASAKAFGEYFTVPVAEALLAETFGTAVLSAVIFALTHPHNKSTSAISSFAIPPTIGATVAALICAIAPITQAGFNPARDFGPRIVAWLAGWSKAVAFQHAWVYVFAPCVGAVLGAAFVDKILYKTTKSSA